MEFFGQCDHKDNDKRKPIASTYPCWYFDGPIEQMKEDIANTEHRLKVGLVPDAAIAETRAHLEKTRGRLAEIEAARPNLEGRDKEKAWKTYKELRDEIRDSMPTYDDMRRGLANPHEEHRRNIGLNGGINVKKMGAVQLMRALNVSPREDGTITRNQARKAYKILGKALGENTNIERLRRFHSGGTFRNEMGVNESIRENN